MFIPKQNFEVKVTELSFEPNGTLANVVSLFDSCMKLSEVNRTSLVKQLYESLPEFHKLYINSFIDEYMGKNLKQFTTTDAIPPADMEWDGWDVKLK